jgi:hypothetical protein
MIKTKSDYYKQTELYRTGNTLKAWKNINELLEDSYDGYVSARNTKLDGNKIPQKKRIYYEKKHNLKNIIKKYGYLVEDYIFFEGPLDKNRTLQGEIVYADKLYLHYTYLKMPLGLAMATGDISFETNLLAKQRLKRYCDPRSYDMIFDLIDLYCGEANTNCPVIEFTCFNIPVGLFKINTLIWEVRNY